jgi:outer membrane protein assembly factor BamD
MNKRSFFPSVWFPSNRAASLAGLAVAALLVTSLSATAQVTGSTTSTTDANGKPQTTVTLSDTTAKKSDKVVQSKDTRKENAKEKKIAPVDSGLPDKVLYDKALDATKRGHFDVARLDLQTLLNTYPDSQYQMKAKLAIADSWYKEGGTAALTQAEQEYKDFITFFPNAPEAAEAQMRVGDIYFRQMDKPDRDYSKATHAEEEYRLMLQQFPDSSLVPQAKQRLREVQEVMALRESEIASFYAVHSNNWPAAIARYQTVVDTYPQYSHMDDVLIGLGDAYETQARYIRTLKLPEAAKAALEKTYDDRAIAAYSKVVLEHSAAPHVEDARDRLDAMNVPVPKPTPEQIAASVALENSRRQYRLQDRATLLFMHQPDVVQAAREGDPTLADPAPTMAPAVTKDLTNVFNAAMNPNAAKAATPAPAPGTAAPAAEAAATPAAGTPAQPATAGAPLAFQDVSSAPAAGVSGSSAVTSVQGNGNTTTAAPATGGSGSNVGVEILGTNPNVKANDSNGGLKAVGPENATPLPAAEKPAETPTQVNDIAPGSQPAAQAPNANGKNPKPEFDKADESSSKHKKKKGLSKLNPF